MRSNDLQGKVRAVGCHSHGDKLVTARWGTGRMDILYSIWGPASPLGKSIIEWLRDGQGKAMMGVGTDKNLSSQKKKTGPLCREQKKLCRIFQSCKGQNMDGVIISRETDLCVLKMHFFSSWTRLILTKALVAALLYNFHSFLWVV